MNGARAFAVAVLAAVALLPKTSWVVRSQIDLLAGGWGPFGTDLGVKPAFGLIPHRIFRGPLDDPAARALATVESTAYGDLPILERAKGALADPELRDEIRGSVVRQGFVGIHPSAFEGQRRAETIARAEWILALAEEGERARPGNAFYPATQWALLTRLGRPSGADAALARAAGGDRFDDEALLEGDLVARAVEAQHGYRGQIARLVAQLGVLFPEYAEIKGAARKVAEVAPLDDPRRRQIMRLGLAMARSAPTKIGAILGGDLAFEAAGRPLRERSDRDLYTERFAAFRAANPSFDLAPYQTLFERTREAGWPDMEALRKALDYPAMPAGAALLLATLLALGLGWPCAGEPDETPRARLRRAPWAWLAAVPALFLPNVDAGAYGFIIYPSALAALALLWVVRKVRPGVAMLVLAAGATFVAGVFQPFWWVGRPCWWAALPLAAAAIWLPARFRSALLVAGALGLSWTVTYDAINAGGHGDNDGAILLAAIGAAALRACLPTRRGFALPVSILALLYLGSVAFALRTDAQQGEVVQAFREEGERFRVERGIKGLGE